MVSIPAFLPPDESIIGNTGGTIVGAIRWDGWHHPTEDGVRVAVETSLGPSQYNWRVPFFGSVNPVSISGIQASMDAEIDFAVSAGLNYWAFLWYGTADAMQQAWTYFQASSKKNNINWCMIYSGFSKLTSEVTNHVADHVGYMQQTNYQTVLAGRPLIFVFDDGSSQTGFVAAVTSLRNAATAAGLPNPYIAFMTTGLPSAAQVALISSMGLDALSKYTWGPSVLQPRPHTVLDASVRNMWAEYAKLSVQAIPGGVIGWDRRPRVENPVPWESPNGTLSDYYYPERMGDISRHVDHLLKWVRDNPTKAVANTAILYAWNEHDEGGFLDPLLTSGTPNTGRLDALKKVLVG